ncbi:MAG: septum formation protein Maf [Crocinitomicaceae bacterium]|nr:septum formation protein Maf [Crocinitomicaceae bacterium]
MLDNLKNKKVILASKSPRRQQLLSGLDIEFEIRTKDVEEVYPADMIPVEVPEYLAKLKADEFKGELKDNEIIITSDTIVVLEGDILEKPYDWKEAKEMLRMLSGKTHTVITGVCIRSNNKEVSFSDHTEVTFCELTEEEIEYYVSKYKPFDKAGSYGVQEWIGYIAIDNLEGSYFNVMGLPLNLVYKELKEF